MKAPPEKRKIDAPTSKFQKSDEDQNSGNSLSPQLRWNRAHKAERMAHAMVAQAVKRGEIKRGSCLVCGSECVDLHHPDAANQPLWVIPVCRKHHQRLHAELRRLECGAVDG